MRCRVRILSADVNAADPTRTEPTDRDRTLHPGTQGCPAASRSAEPPVRDGCPENPAGWTCSTCTFDKTNGDFLACDVCGTSRDAAAAPVCGIPGNAAAAAPADGIPGNAAAAPAVAAAVAPAPRTPSPTPPDLPTPTPPDPARPPGVAVVPATPTQKRRRRRTGASAAEAIDVDADAAGRQHAEEQQCVVAFLVDELEQRETRIQQLEKDLAASRAGGARGPVSPELDDAIGQEDDDADRRRLEKRRSQVVRFFVSVEVELQELSGFDFRRGGRTPGAKASLGRLAGRCDAALLNAL